MVAIESVVKTIKLVQSMTCFAREAAMALARKAKKATRPRYCSNSITGDSNSHSTDVRVADDQAIVDTPQNAGNQPRKESKFESLRFSGPYLEDEKQQDETPDSIDSHLGIEPAIRKARVDHIRRVEIKHVCHLEGTVVGATSGRVALVAT
jgi:hypothetical protein